MSDDIVEEDMQIVEEPQTEPAPAPKKKWKNTRGVERKREVARANLAKGRAKKLEMLREKKKLKEQEYDIDADDEDDSEEELEEFILSKIPKKRPPAKRARESEPDHEVLDKINSLADVVGQLVDAQNKRAVSQRKPRKPKAASNKIVLITPQAQTPAAIKGAGAGAALDPMLEALRRSLL